MNLPQRKPPAKVKAIKGDFRPDVISQEELRNAAELQATVWLAEKNAREAVQKIEARILAGATLEPGELTFDQDLQMARRAG